MSRIRKFAHAVLALAALSTWQAPLPSAHAQDSFDIDLDALTAESPAAGTTIDAGNLALHAALLDAEVAALVAAGDMEIAVGEPQSFAPHASYAAATREHLGQATLGASPGELLDYTAGLPFPGGADHDDQRAGDKLAWNMRYAWSGDNGELEQMIWGYRDMRKDKLERQVRFAAKNLRFMHRHVEPPLPEIAANPGKIYMALYLRSTYPPDVKDTQLLIHRLEDDTQQEQGWMYVPFQRRVRRLATGQKTDAFLGSDIMIEDFLGYNGRIKDMEWTYKGSTRMLLPMFRHNDLADLADEPGKGFRFVNLRGRGGCFPSFTWQLRDVHRLQGLPRERSHPLSKRVFYIDAQTSTAPVGLIYDRAGKLWKVAIAGLSHPDHHLPENSGSGVPIFDGATMVDLQARHCTTIQTVTRVNVADMQPSQFMPNAMSARGR